MIKNIHGVHGVHGVSTCSAISALRVRVGYWLCGVGSGQGCHGGQGWMDTRQGWHRQVAGGFSQHQDNRGRFGQNISFIL